MIDERLRAVEIALAKVDQRLLTIERVILPALFPHPAGDPGLALRRLGLAP